MGHDWRKTMGLVNFKYLIMKKINIKSVLSNIASLIGGILSFILVYSLFKDIYDDITNKKKFNELIKQVNDINKTLNNHLKK